MVGALTIVRHICMHVTREGHRGLGKRSLPSSSESETGVRRPTKDGHVCLKPPEISAEKAVGGWTFRCRRAAGWRATKPEPVDMSAFRGRGRRPGSRAPDAPLDPRHAVCASGGPSLFVPDDLIAQWEIAPGDLADIGLPPLCSFRLSLSADQPITGPKGNLKPTWLDAKHRPVPAVERDGTLVSSGRGRYLLRDPLRSLVDAVDYMNEALRRRREAEAVFGGASPHP